MKIVGKRNGKSVLKRQANLGRNNGFLDRFVLNQLLEWLLLPFFTGVIFVVFDYIRDQKGKELKIKSLIRA